MEVMEKGDTDSLLEKLSESHITPVDASWLNANIEAVNRSYNQIQELVENGADIFADKCYERQSQLMIHVEEILYKHQLLVEQYEKLQSCNDNSSALRQKDAGATTIIGFSNESCFQTPDMKSINHGVNAEAPSSVSSQMSGGGSCGTSGKEGSEYSFISSDSGFEIYKPSAYKSARSHLDAYRMLEQHFEDKEEVGGRDEGLLGRLSKYEEEINLSSKKLQLSEREVSRLQKELEELTGTFESQLNSAQSELQKREIALEMEKEKVVVLQNQISILESQIVNSNTQTGSLELELGIANKLNLEKSEEDMTALRSRPSNENPDYSTELKNQLELAQQQVALLDAKLDGQKRRASEMKDNIRQYISDILHRDDWIHKLETILREVTDKSREDEVKLQSHISSFTEHLMIVEASSNKWSNRCESLEVQLQQCEADMTEMRRLHEIQEIRWKSDIDLFKTELNEKVGLVETLNKGLDTLKLSYDALDAENVAAIQALEAEVSCTKDLRDQLRLKEAQMISASESARKQFVYAGFLEKVVKSQKFLILDKEEEKREAIRQLCFTMEYYRNRCEEVVQACKKGLKQQ